MIKPEFKTEVTPFLDYFDVKEYITKKYNCDKEEDKTWDYMCNYGEVKNDSYSYIPTHLNNAFTNAVKEEFGENPKYGFHGDQ